MWGWGRDVSYNEGNGENTYVNENNRIIVYCRDEGVLYCGYYLFWNIDELFKFFNIFYVYKGSFKCNDVLIVVFSTGEEMRNLDDCVN